MVKSAKDLRAASYNPRTISNTALNNLNLSIESFGDLSGITFNRRTKTLVGGHQRVASLKKWPSKAELKPHKDQYGTVEQGYMVYTTDRGTIRIPLRIVEWDLKREKQANIAANMHGGDFDRQKLATLVAELETDKKFSIELLGMDAHDLTMLHRFLPSEEMPTDDEGNAQEFESVVDKVEKSKASMACCPRCKFRFEPK